MNLPKENPTDKFIRLLCFGVSMLFACGKAFGGSATLTPIDYTGDGTITTNNNVGGRVAWQCAGSHFMYFDVPASFTFTTNTPVYVTFNYYDAGDGLIKMEYDGTNYAYIPTETHARSSRIKTGNYATCYQQLAHPVLGGHENGHADLRLDLEDDDGTPLSVEAGSVVIQTTAFTNATFQAALTKPWLNAYTNETRWDDVDATFLTDKVMCGYQGWFQAPNDLQDEGWVHWVRNGRMVTTNLNTDQWPDMSEYPSNSYFQAEDIKTASGKQAYAFSDADPAAVEVQFQWMRKYNIDGVFLQRFLKNSDPPAGQSQEWALANVRQAAHAEGRVWVIEYDLSSLSDGNAFKSVTNDWMWLVNTVKILQDSRYGHQNNKPVVAIYGMGNTSKPITTTTANKIISWFKTNSVYGPCYVWGGVPTDWLSEWSSESSVYTSFDAISVWHSGNYGADVAKCATFGATYWPVIWPGFSWSNEQTNGNNGAFKPRNGGTFYWTKIYNALTNSSVSSLFVGMFDEYDEGTAIMPMSDDPPPQPVGWWDGIFIDNDGMSSDWWMLLTGAAKAEMFQNTNNPAMPTELSLTNRSNIGPEVDDTLETNDVENRLYRVPVAFDGNTSVESQQGKVCRYNINPATNHCFYFDVDDNFAHQTTTLPDMDMTIEVEYYDATGSVTFKLEYDGTSGPYTLHSEAITTQGTDRWRTARFEISDAYFDNEQNGGADFRVRVIGTSKLDVSRVWVRKDELKYGIWELDDIGSVGAPGSGDIDEITDTYTVNGSGTDIFGTSDSFAFCNQPLSGDGQIIALVNSVENTATAAKAGVMIRSSLASNSAHVALVMTPGSGIKYLIRPTAGASTTQITATNLVAPYWVKITRAGNVFNSYCSPDSVSWTLLGTTNVSMPTDVFMGAAVTSKSNDVLNTSIFQYISVMGDPQYDYGL